MVLVSHSTYSFFSLFEWGQLKLPNNRIKMANLMPWGSKWVCRIQIFNVNERKNHSREEYNENSTITLNTWKRIRPKLTVIKSQQIAKHSNDVKETTIRNCQETHNDLKDSRFSLAMWLLLTQNNI